MLKLLAGLFRFDATVGCLVLEQRETAAVNRRANSLRAQCEELERELEDRTRALAEYRGQVSLLSMMPLLKLVPDFAMVQIP